MPVNAEKKNYLAGETHEETSDRFVKLVNQYGDREDQIETRDLLHAALRNKPNSKPSPGPRPRPNGKGR